MKKIYTGIILTAGLFLTACQNNMQDITVQSITEPIATQQTVRNVPEVTEVTESAAGTVRVTNTDNWTEPVATEPDDPGACTETEAYTGVTLPNALNADEQSSIIADLFRKELPEYPWSSYETGFSDYDECNECYKRFLVEKLLEDEDAFNCFSGAYFCDGWLHIQTTDYYRRDDIFGGYFDGLSVDISGSYKYSYCDLVNVWGVIQQYGYATGHIINFERNLVEVYGNFSDEDVGNINAALEEAGYSSDAFELVFDEEVSVANPC